MKYHIVALLILATFSHGRENPFEPINIAPTPLIAPKAPKIIAIPVNEVKKEVQSAPVTIEIKQPSIQTKPITTPKVSAPYIKPVIKKELPKKSAVKKQEAAKEILLYKHRYLTIVLVDHMVKIITKDSMLKDSKHKQAQSLSFDFERFDAIKQDTMSINTNYLTQLRIENHGYFYRVVLKTPHALQKITKTDYGYLILITND